MAEYTHVGPGLPPLHGAQANALILGSFPSPKSREQGFFYGHTQNRFWPMIAAVTGEPVPDWADIEAKKRIICATVWPCGIPSAPATYAGRQMRPSATRCRTMWRR